MSTITKDLGVVTAYGYYKAGGGTMTESEFTQFMVDFGTASQTATEAAQAAAESAQESAASSADAQDSAEEARQSASTASAKATEATTAAATATAKASEASESAATATTAKTDAESARDAAAQSASEAAESARTLTIDATLTQSGQAADAKETGNKITNLKEDLTNLQGIEWTNGYIKPNGTIISTMVEKVDDRCYSNLLICPPNVEVKYVAESNHANIAGISFYDMSGTFVGGIANNGMMGEEMVVTSPNMCAFCRLSTRVSIKNDSYYRVSSQGIEYIVKSLSPVTKKELLFFGDGSNRPPYNYNVENVMKVTVTDDDYEIALIYKKADGTETNTSWCTTINVASFDIPVAFKMRRADNAVIPNGTVLDVVDVVRSTDFVTIGDMKITGYVNKNGSDENDGLSKGNALLTISAAIGKGFKNILIGEGVYTESIIIDGISGLHISLDMSGNSFVYPDSTNNPKVVIDGANTNAQGIKLTNCYNCDFEGIEVRNVATYAWDIDNCSDIKISDCCVHDIAVGAQTGMGFKVADSNVDFYNCIAYNIGATAKGTATYHIDGFNIHGTGTVNLIDCSAWNCEDDGVSHHDATCGIVDGGEWYNCGKGGVASPTHGAKVNIKNVYSHDNGNGIYAWSDRADIAKTVLVSGCILKDNALDIDVSNNTLKVWNCIFDTQAARESGSIDIIT